MNRQAGEPSQVQLGRREAGSDLWYSAVIPHFCHFWMSVCGVLLLPPAICKSPVSASPMVA